MHVKMDRPEDRSLALKWRGDALDGVQRTGLVQPARGRAKCFGRMQAACCAWMPRRGSAGQGRFISYAVYLSDLAPDNLFFAGTPQFMRIDSFVVRRPFGNYTCQFGDSRNICYQGYSRLETPALRRDARLSPCLPMPAELYLQLPRSTRASAN